MLTIKSLSVKLSDTKKEVLNNIDLTFQKGKTYYIRGRNGSGKSSLLNIIAGLPDLEVTSGEINLRNNGVNIDLLDKSLTERSLLGIFLAFQTPLEIPGVDLFGYLRLIYNVRQKKEEQLPVFKFRELLMQKAKLIDFPEKLLRRNLNEGFSGGEKKKTEILQMLLIKPKIVLLDEVDSGLDKQSIKEVFSALNVYKKQNPNTIFIVVSHYDDVIKYLPADSEIEIVSGKVAKS